MKSASITFIIRLSLFLLVLVSADHIVGYLLGRAYNAQQKGQFAKTTYAIETTSQDILIFGSSRAVRHYDPLILEDSLKMTAYNVGRDAQMIPYYTALEESILLRYKPKMIILDINSWELSPGMGKYEKLSVLLPYCDRHPELVKYISESSEWEKFKLHIKTYPYNSSLFVLFYNYFFPNLVATDQQGFAPLYGRMTYNMLTDHIRRMNLGEERKYEVSKEIDVKALAYYNRFLSLAAKNHIKTYVVISPKILSEELTYKTKKLMEAASKYPNVKFINYSNDPKYNLKFEKFSDVFHLNNKGADEFTRDLIKDLK